MTQSNWHFPFPFLLRFMLLTIDIGNSSTKYGFFQDKDLIEKVTIKTVRDQSEDKIYSQIQSNLPGKPSTIIISSVVTELRLSYKRFGEKYFNASPFFVDHTFDFGFPIKYFPPEDCGPDRLVDAFAGVETYGAPCIVCDFGTATTIDMVSQNREYLGGIIAPGINTFASVLYERTSKLPDVELEKPRNIIGNSTAASIRSGIYFGYVGLVDGIIERMANESRSAPNVVSTGGFARMIAEESKHVEVIEDNLILEGLRLIHEKRRLNES